MNNQRNRYYRKIRTILQIDPKTIHEEFVTSLGPSAPSSTTVTRWAKRFRQGREDVNHHPRSARLQLTHEQLVKLCHEDLAKFQHDSCRLCDIITDDETWIYHRQIHHKSKNAS